MAEIKDPRVFETSDTVSKETILKISKEITVKFIEVGRITPATFPTAFTTIHTTINQVVRDNSND